MIRFENPGETYRSVVKLIHNVVHIFIAEKGGNWYELRSEADSGYVDALHSYNPNKDAQFGTWVAVKVKAALMQYNRREQRIARKFKPIDPFKLAEYAEKDEFDVDDLIDNLSKDAQEVVSLLFEQPVTLRHMIGPCTQHPPTVRKCIRNYLRQTRDWTRPRMIKAFNEITIAIGGRLQ